MELKSVSDRAPQAASDPYLVGLRTPWSAAGSMLIVAPANMTVQQNCSHAAQLDSRAIHHKPCYRLWVATMSTVPPGKSNEQLGWQSIA